MGNNKSADENANVLVEVVNNVDAEGGCGFFKTSRKGKLHPHNHHDHEPQRSRIPTKPLLQRLAAKDEGGAIMKKIIPSLLSGNISFSFNVANQLEYSGNSSCRQPSTPAFAYY
jgi:hypothetical protein